MKLTKISAALLFLTPAYLSAATQDFTYLNGYKITVDQASPEVSIQIKNNKPTQSITTPNSEGISHNYFTEFNVGRNGLNIDNAPSARVIINEVTGTDISHLDGKMAVIGKQASLIIANPNGINCNNCGVSNVNHLILLAGNTVPDNTTGRLSGYNNITGDISVENIRKYNIKSRLTLTANSINITDSFINSPRVILNTGADNIIFSDVLKSQISDVKLTRGRIVHDSDSHAYSFIDSNTKIRGNLVVNAKNASLLNDGNIVSSNIYLNLMHSEFVNDGYLKASNININAKNGSITNHQKMYAKNLTADYNGDFSIYNDFSTTGSNILSVNKMSINSHNINNMIDLNSSEHQGYTRDNLLTIKNEGNYSTAELNIAGKHDQVKINNEARMYAGRLDINAGSVAFYTDGDLSVNSESAVHGIIGVYGNGSNHKNISVSRHNFEM